ncbi:MAG: hypothetical protein R3F08_08785 [Dokdonella sp.]
MPTRASHWNPVLRAAITCSAVKSSQRALLHELRSVPRWRIRVTAGSRPWAGSTRAK